MVRIPPRAGLALALSLLLTPSCTLVAVDSADGPPGLRAHGVIDGHVAFGFRAEEHFLRAELFDGTSDGAWFEVSLWKLARIEAGVAGFGLGLGPIDVGLGTLFFDPDVPRMMRRGKGSKKKEKAEPEAPETTSEPASE